MARIFISYRHADTTPLADLLYKVSVQQFGPRGVFRDIYSIPTGAEFVTVLQDTIALSDIVLVLIGPDWLTVSDPEGHPRIVDPGDFVHQEVAFALHSGALVVPILLDDTPMPQASELPADIAALTLRQARRIHLTNQHMMTGEVAALVQNMQTFIRITPRQPEMYRQMLTLPLLAAIVFSQLLIFHQHHLILNIVLFLMLSVFWSIPLLIMAAQKQWSYLANTLGATFLFILLSTALLNDPNVLTATGVIAAVALEELTLSLFARKAPRQPRSFVAISARPISRTLAQVIIVLSAAWLVFMGLDIFNSAVQPESVNLGQEIVIIYASFTSGVLIVIGAIVKLYIDRWLNGQVMRSSSSWGDIAQRAQLGLQNTELRLRLALLLAPSLLWRIVPQAVHDSIQSVALGAVGLESNIGVLVLGAILSLIPIVQSRRHSAEPQR